MNRCRWRVTLMRAALVCCFLWLGRCSVGPLAGGTETRNPEIAACAQVLFDETAPGTLWEVEKQIPGGLGRLDPVSAYGVGVASDRGLAKSAATTDSAPSMHVIRRVIYLPHVTIVDDTLLSFRTVTDTLPLVINQDTVWVFTQRKITDSVFVFDTLSTMDSIVYFDTLYIDDRGLITSPGTVADSWYPGDRFRSPVYSPVVGLSYSFISGDNFYVIPAPATNYRVIKQALAQVMGIARHFEPSSGLKIREEYADEDGDSLLLGSQTNAPAKVRFTVHALGVAFEETSHAHYDAGPDRELSTVTDNTIGRLFKRSLDQNGTNEYTFVRDSSESLRVHVGATRNQGPVQSRLSRFTVHAVNRNLLGIQANRVYRQGSINAISAEIEILGQVLSGDTPSRARFRCVCELRDGFQGILTGEIDTAAGELIGSYEKNGKQVRVIARRDGTVTEE